MAPSRVPFRLRLARFLRGIGERVVAAPLVLASWVLPALPTRVAVWIASGLGFLVYAFDPRGRKAGHQNLEVAFGDELTAKERRRILRGSYRNALTAEVLLFHLQPLTAERWRKVVKIRPEDDVRFREMMRRTPVVVFVSGHYGNWEMMLAARTALDYAPETAYLAESTGRPRVDALFRRLRDRGSGGAAKRKSGAMALKAAMGEKKSACLLVDRNVRGLHGGRYVPFLGLPARTTPLPAMLSRWYGVPLAVLLLLPEGRATWRLWISPDVSVPRTDDEDADLLAATTRMNDVISRVIREQPEAWAWMIKRWKSRPTPELGPYPAYSLFDADPGP